MGSNRHKQEHGKWQLDIKKNIFHEDCKKWGKGEGILEILKTPLDKTVLRAASQPGPVLRRSVDQEPPEASSCPGIS